MTRQQAQARATVLLDRTDLILQKSGPLMARYGGQYSISIPVRTRGDALCPSIPYLREVVTGQSWQETIDRLEVVLAHAQTALARVMKGAQP